ncbi:DUF6292 family protein [Amycolatopsis sp. NBRC 101858]|uniref:DUF6292 family protein n=1 Tax=Amycolatopsis sp. NBRC 101858 TaxID=3032200 RepID=UPI003336C77A
MRWLVRRSGWPVTCAPSPCGGRARQAAAWELGGRPAAYLALPDRCAGHPERDVMVIWSAERGWKGLPGEHGSTTRRRW